jgi:hypothetical protein
MYSIRRIANFVFELSLKVQFHTWTTKTLILVLKLSKPTQIRPSAYVEPHVDLPCHHPIRYDGQILILLL